jgi:L-lactate dehydrogenase complex protein LldE
MSNNTVHFFTTCLVDQIYPQIGVAVVKLLRRVGFKVCYPADQVCCGQPFYNSGYVDEARKLAEHTIEVLAEAEQVVIPSGSCTAMIRHEYSMLFSGQPEMLEKAELLASKTYEFTEFMVEKTSFLDGRLSESFSETEVTYHDSCHMCRNLGIREPPRDLLSAVGLRVAEMEESDRCCGFGGVFYARMPEVSQAMVQEKLRLAERSGAPRVVSADPGCMMRMQHKKERSIEVVHIAEILEEATR